MTNKLFAFFALTYSLQAAAVCVELLPQGAAAPNLFEPRIYKCEGSVGGANSYQEGNRLGKEEALKEAANFPAIVNCRQMGLDQTSRQKSFCHPQTFCTEFKTILYFSCGQGEIL